MASPFETGASFFVVSAKCSKIWSDMLRFSYFIMYLSYYFRPLMSFGQSTPTIPFNWDFLPVVLSEGGVLNRKWAQLAAEPIALSMQTAQTLHWDYLTPYFMVSYSPCASPVALPCSVGAITGVGSSLWLAYISVYFETYEELHLVLL